MNRFKKPFTAKLNFIKSRVRENISKFISKFIIYFLLIEFVFVFIYPFIFMIMNSLKFDSDFSDLNRQWVLIGIDWDNYKNAFALLNFIPSLFVNLLVSILPTIGHVLSCAFIAYGVARFNFKGRNLVFSLIILTILIPPLILQMPLYIQFAKFGWIGTVLPIIIPAFFGFGLKGGLFIFIFMQFFKGLPYSYEESAKIEGCGSLDVYFRIMLPLSKTSVLVVSTLSAIWHWNDMFEPNAYLTGSVKTLTQMLSAMPTYLYQSTSASGLVVSPVQLAACVLIILPLLIIFAVTQKWFMEGMEFSGLAN